MAHEQAEKKIIIDEDWKTQVQAEKERLEQERQRQQQPADGAAETEEGSAAKMPPASFAMLISALATEAMVGLGQLPTPGSQEPRVNLEQAQYFIDTLAVLEEKTRGNLTPDESQTLTALLHQLRLAFVNVRDQQPA